MNGSVSVGSPPPDEPLDVSVAVVGESGRAAFAVTFGPVTLILNPQEADALVSAINAAIIDVAFG